MIDVKEYKDIYYNTWVVDKIFIAADIDDISDKAGADEVNDLIAALGDLAEPVGAYAPLLQERGRAFRSCDIEAHVIEGAHHGQCLFLILIRQRHHHGAVILQLHAGGLQSLEHCM